MLKLTISRHLLPHHQLQQRVGRRQGEEVAHTDLLALLRRGLQTLQHIRQLVVDVIGALLAAEALLVQSADSEAAHLLPVVAISEDEAQFAVQRGLLEHQRLAYAGEGAVMVRLLWGGGRELICNIEIE